MCGVLWRRGGLGVGSMRTCFLIRFKLGCTAWGLRNEGSGCFGGSLGLIIGSGKVDMSCREADEK